MQKESIKIFNNVFEKKSNNSKRIKKNMIDLMIVLEFKYKFKKL